MSKSVYVTMCMWFLIRIIMFFIVRSNNSFDFPLGLIKYIVVVNIYYYIYIVLHLTPYFLQRNFCNDDLETVLQLV